MSMIDCPECGNQISDKAPACPNCGVVLSGTKKAERFPRYKIVLLVVLIVAGAILGGWWRYFIGPQSVLRQPKVVVDERVALNEGQSLIYRFVLKSASRVEVEVNAQPKQVSVMLMSDADAESFRKANQMVFGGQFSMRQAVSSENILSMNKTEILPQGAWSIVVMRPLEAILFGESTTAQIKVTVY